jgi:Fe-S-cluster containining protein
METPLAALNDHDTFYFGCSRQVACFNACCHDLNQFLTGYDILRLKHHLGLSSQAFLREFTRQHLGPETGLPVVSLKPAQGHKMACPFVSEAGCRVYENRPSSCRSYPLVRMVTRCRETGALSQRYFLIEEAHCQGFGRGQAQTVEDWVKSQQLNDYNRENDRFMAVIAVKNRCRPGALNLAMRHLFSMAIYDLDRFRDHVSQGGLGDFSPEPARMEKAGTDDLALLHLGMDWVMELMKAS